MLAGYIHHMPGLKAQFEQPKPREAHRGYRQPIFNAAAHFAVTLIAKRKPTRLEWSQLPGFFFFAKGNDNRFLVTPKATPRPMSVQVLRGIINPQRMDILLTFIQVVL